jgi:hypothetical protein
MRSFLGPSECFLVMLPPLSVPLALPRLLLLLLLLLLLRTQPPPLQIELHPLLAQRKLVGVSYRKGVVSVAHSCLVRQAPEVQDSPLVQRVAAETGKTINQVRHNRVALALTHKGDCACMLQRPGWATNLWGLCDKVLLCQLAVSQPCTCAPHDLAACGHDD